MTLRAQYRCHPAIGTWLQVFYSQPLIHQASPSADYFQLLRPVVTDPRSMENHRVGIINVEDASSSDDRAARETDDKRKVNGLEVTATLELLLRMSVLAKSQSERKSVMLISPYKRQVAKLRKFSKRAEKFFLPHLSIACGNVDAIQGQEFDIVIVSMVRSNDQKNVGFLQGRPDRSLVAFSRGRHYLFVLMSTTTFQEKPTWEKLLQAASNLAIPRYNRTITRLTETFVTSTHGARVRCSRSRVL